MPVLNNKTGELELTQEEWVQKTSDLLAEQCVIGSVLFDAAAAEVAAGTLRREHFWREPHRIIWDAVIAARKHGEPVELATVAAELRFAGQLEAVGGPDYLTVCIGEVPWSKHIRSYMAILLRRHEFREMVALGTDMKTGLMDFDEAMRRMEEVSEIRASMGAVKHIREMPDALEAVEAYIRSFSEEKNRPHLDVEDADRATGGLPTPGYVVVKGPSSFGKTALALQSLLDWTKEHDQHGLLFSLEMKMREQVLPRLVSTYSGIELTPSYLRTADEDEAVATALNAMAHLLCSNLSYHDSTLNIDGLCGRTKQSCAERGTRLVVLDYLQLLDVSGGFGQRWERLRSISMRLKRLSLETGACVMALSQVRGEDYHAEGARGIDDDADMAIRVERDGDTIDERKASTTGKLVIEKNRNGPTGQHPVIFRQVRFWSPDQYAKWQQYQKQAEEAANDQRNR